MISGSEYGIDLNRSVEVPSCPPQVSEVILGYAPEKESVVICSVKLDQDIEVVDSLSVLAIGKSIAATDIEYVLVILGIRSHLPYRKEKEHYRQTFQNPMHIENFC
jgi:hypothetical protein